MEKVRYGIISTAQVVPRFIAGVKESEAGEVAAIASRDLAKAQQAAEKWQIPKAYGSYEALCQDPEIDCVYIATINQGHYSAARLALEHHKPVLMEKPFTLKLREAEELFALAEIQGCFIMEAQKSVFLPAAQQVKALIETGDLGKLHWIQSVTSYPDTSGISWFDSLEAGGGALFSSGSYPIEYIQYVTGKKILRYSGNASRTGDKSDSQSHLALELENGLLASVYITTDLALESRMVICGEKGRIELPSFWKTKEAAVTYQDGTIEKLSGSFESEFVFEISHVNECIRSGKLISPIMTRELTLSAVSLAEQMYTKWHMI